MGIDVALIQPAFGAGDVRKLNICTPPLGLAYIAAFLREHGHRVTIIDAEVEQLNNEQIAQRAKNADLAAITTTAPTCSSAIALANHIKQSNNPTKVVLGGPQATFLDRDCLERSAADAVVRGEGEHTMLSEDTERAMSINSKPKSSGTLVRVVIQANLTLTSSLTSGDSLPPLF